MVLPQSFWLPGQETDDIPYYTGSEWRGRRRPTVASFLTHTGSRGGLAWTAVTAASSIDHGGLAGLGDDDHTQYRLESADHSHLSTGLEGGLITEAAQDAVPSAAATPGPSGPAVAS